MNSDHDSQQNPPDSSDPLLSEGPDELSPAANRERRQLTILEFQDSALKNTDNFASNIAAYMGGLLEMGNYLEELILKKLNSMSGQITDFAEVSPAFDSHLRLGTQIERYANLKIRLEGLAKHAAAGKPTPLSAAFSALSPDDSRSTGTSPDRADRVKRAK